MSPETSHSSHYLFSGKRNWGPMGLAQVKFQFMTKARLKLSNRMPQSLNLAVWEYGNALNGTFDLELSLGWNCFFSRSICIPQASQPQHHYKYLGLDNSLLWGAAIPTVDCLKHPLHPLDASSLSPDPFVTTKKQPQTSPRVIWGTKLPQVENHCSDWYLLIILKKW